GDEVPLKKLADLEDEGNSKCIIIGTLFKHQELKPSILKEISEEFQLIPQQKVVRFISESDTLILEDELQRIRLLGNIDVGKTVTGIVCAVIGAEDGTGKFNVEDCCWPGCPVPEIPRQVINDNRYLLLVSGLELCSTSGDCLMSLQLLLSWISGWIGEPGEQQAISNSTIDVDLMPGEFDPTNFTLPQQPIHYCMFPKALCNATFRSVTNPHMLELFGATVVGSSGQPVSDVCAFSTAEDPLEALHNTLTWGHLAPTAPDTISEYHILIY
ncbi:hypothetical protein AAG570_013833, partial [Ranatra chinensis]